MTQALEAYQQQLNEANLSSEENNHHYHDLLTKLKNESWTELSLTIDNFPYPLLHGVRVSPEESAHYGVIIVLENDRGTALVLDGNHRINTLKELQDPTPFPVLLIRGYVPKN